MRVRIASWVGAMLACGVAAFNCGGDEFAAQGASAAAGASGTDAGAGAAGAGGSSAGGAGGATGGAAGTTGGAAGTGAGGTGAGGATGGSAGAGAGGTGGAAGSAPQCGAGFCAPTPPAGWNGPIVIVQADNMPAEPCPSQWPNEVFVGHEDIAGVPPLLPCTCSCDPGTVTCPAPVIHSFPTSDCTNAACSTLALNGSCQGVSSTVCGAGVEAARVIAPPNGTCKPVIQASPPAWKQTVRGCAQPAAGSSCDSGTCVPAPAAPASALVCIYRSGQEGCPPDYPEVQSTHETADDRKCGGTCQCAQPLCGTLRAYSDTGCNSALPAEWPVPVGCVSALAQAHSFKFEPKIVCNAAPFTPVISGGVQQQPVTVCCRNATDG